MINLCMPSSAGVRRTTMRDAVSLLQSVHSAARLKDSMPLHRARDKAGMTCSQAGEAALTAIPGAPNDEALHPCAVTARLCCRQDL
eukprot:193111-Chlamydomonas_euryale.AAC.8